MNYKLKYTEIVEKDKRKSYSIFTEDGIHLGNLEYDEVDNCVYCAFCDFYSPKDVGAWWSSWILRDIANKMDEINEEMDKLVDQIKEPKDEI